VAEVRPAPRGDAGWLTVDGRRGVRQDAPGPCKRPRGCRRSSQTASGGSELAPLSDPGAGAAGDRRPLGLRGRSEPADAGPVARSTCARSGCCWCWTTASTWLPPAPFVRTRCCTPRPWLRILATSREPLAIAGEDDLPRAVAGDADPAHLPPRRRLRSSRRCACSSSARRRAAGFAGTPGNGAAVPRSAGGWTASRWRSSWRRPASRSCGGGAARQAGRPLPGADGRQPDGPAAPAHAARHHGLELRSAGRSGADPAAPAGGGLPAGGRSMPRRPSARGRAFPRSRFWIRWRGWSTSRW